MTVATALMPEDDDDARRMVHSLVEQWRAAKADLEQAERRCRGLIMAIEGLLIMHPNLLDQVPPEARPSPAKRAREQRRR
jgi:hypothetical protein